MNRFAIQFPVFGFPVRIEPTFFLILLLLAMTSQLSLVANMEIVFWIGLSVLIHELGHALSGRAFGMESVIRLHFLGGLTQWNVKDGKEPGNWEHVLISLAGPMAGFIFGGIVLLSVELFDYWPHIQLDQGIAVRYLLFFNFGWGLANLAPVFPLDGGQVMFYLLRMRKGLNSVQITSIVSMVIGAGLAVWMVMIEQYIILLLLMWLIGINYNRLQASGNEGSADEVDQIHQLRSAGKLEEALAHTHALLKETSSSQYKQWGYLMAAHLLLRIDKPEVTRQFLKEHPKHMDYNPILTYLGKRVEEGEEKALAFIEPYFRLDKGPEMVVLMMMHSGRNGDLVKLHDLMEEFREEAWFKAAVRELVVYFQRTDRLDLVSVVMNASDSKVTDPQLAYSLAVRCAEDGAEPQAIKWLQRLVALGFMDKARIMREAAFDRLHHRGDFRDLMSELPDLD